MNNSHNWTRVVVLSFVGIVLGFISFVIMFYLCAGGCVGDQAKYGGVLLAGVILFPLMFIWLGFKKSLMIGFMLFVLFLAVVCVSLLGYGII